MSRLNFGRIASTHLTRAMKFSSVGLSGLALNMFLQAVQTLHVAIYFMHEPGDTFPPLGQSDRSAIGQIRQLTHSPDQQNRARLDQRDPTALAHPHHRVQPVANGRGDSRGISAARNQFFDAFLRDLPLQFRRERGRSLEFLLESAQTQFLSKGAARASRRLPCESGSECMMAFTTSR
jgi:hypothetical protein